MQPSESKWVCRTHMPACLSLSAQTNFVKMANQGAKKRAEENAKRIAALRMVLAAGFVCQLLRLALLWSKGQPLTWPVTGTTLTILVAWFCFSGIAAFAAPVYDRQTGELIDGGADLSMGGMCAYYHDVLYITSFVQVGLCVLQRS